ncbi:hypothetical protein H6F93_16070 [Leptolyngbya sp. FACHB-671]|uniref:hypothetical protein n=1 Tax=Leptolyngbya sp. FACHB-671 TaxID=2692812 RepID=UPI00168736F2|nr:hypothetical protein [Leptolyngbya sp. FACHB-671]MBD2069017.1 hypothetical protein [Leptolyngbya sp. FACHB-671]
MLDSPNLFLTGTALETLAGWSNLLKTFQQRLGSYFARSEARQAAVSQKPVNDKVDKPNLASSASGVYYFSL